MSNSYVGEIRIFGGNYAPRYWAFCDGQLLSIQEYTTLYAVIGTTYGGNGTTSFGLPDFRGRIPVHMGIGPGVTIPWQQGMKQGTEIVTLDETEMPVHSHSFNVSPNTANVNTPSQESVIGSEQHYADASNMTSTASLADESLEVAGGSLAHNNMMPFQCMSFIICLTGDFPARN
ncbi:phage tail protein [Gynuella sp.]|uniref:phage tail protein n=1 Tax=Gynuella sp. TaxID=2969146 RepID=UPI003D0CA8CF